MNKVLTRRAFLSALGAAFAAACRPAGRTPPTIYSPGSTLAGNSTNVPNTALPSDLPTLPESVPITEGARLYEKSYRGIPDLNYAASWTLVIDGLVSRPLRLSLAEIRALPSVEAMRTLQCISNPVGGGLVGNLVWTGTPLLPLLEQAGIMESARFAWFEAADGYTTSVPVARIAQPETLLVYGIRNGANSEPLPPEHGHPLRILMPGLYGQKMPKWITRIQFAAEVKLGYWENPARGWSNEAMIKTNSQIRSPTRSGPLRTVIRVEGMAFAGGRAITRVEVSIVLRDQRDDWQPATLIRPPDGLAWTWWAYDWRPAAPGDYRLAVRATDETGFTQSVTSSGFLGDPFPDGTDALHSTIIRLT